MTQWDETTGRDIPDDSLLSDDELARCTRADAGVPRTPIPTQIVSNGEYLPLPQSQNQKRVEARVNELAESASCKLGVSRRASCTGGMAASFLAMNEVFGPFFNTDTHSCPQPAADAPRPLRLDDQLHMVRGSAMTPPAPSGAQAERNELQVQPGIRAA
jgi:hypothetical protein